MKGFLPLKLHGLFSGPICQLRVLAEHCVLTGLFDGYNCIDVVKVAVYETEVNWKIYHTCHFCATISNFFSFNISNIVSCPSTNICIDRVNSAKSVFKGDFNIRTKCP